MRYWHMPEGQNRMKRRWNLFIWAGFAVTGVAFLSYFLIFYRFPVTRDVPWANYVLFAVGIWLVAIGVKRAFGHPDRYRGKIAGSILSVLSVTVLGLFVFSTVYATRQLPASKGTPRVGEKAPDFTLPDEDGKPLALSSLLTSPVKVNGGGQGPSAPGTLSEKTNAAVLIFYRGYW